MSDELARLEWVTRTTAAMAGRYLALSDEIWELAELRFQEHRSVAAQSALLEAEGFHVKRNVAGLPTAFVAEAGDGAPILGFLGEDDALAGLSQCAGEAAPRHTEGSSGGRQGGRGTIESSVVGPTSGLSRGDGSAPARPSDAPDPLTAARQRGEQAKRGVLAPQRELLTAEQVTARLGVPPSEVERRRAAGLLLGLPLGPGQLGYPAWQRADDGLLPGFEDVLGALPANGS